VPHRKITSLDRLYALIDAMLLIEADAELATLLQRIVTEAAELVGARYGALGVLDDEGSSLREFITTGVTDAQRLAIGAPPVGLGLLGHVIDEGRVIRVTSLEADPEAVGFPPNHPAMTTFLGVPVRTGTGAVYGNLYLCDRADGVAFDDEDEAVVEALGRAAGLLIDEAHLRLKLRELTLLEERARLARDLHDIVIQRLFAVGLSLQATAGADLPADVERRITTAIDDLDATVREIRTTIFEISRDRSPAGAGVRSQLLDLVDEVATRLGLPVTVEFAGPVDVAVGSVCADHLVRAARELLTNVVRHAHASRASLKLVVADGSATLEVADDGIGPTPDHTFGYGLRNLSERAEAVGGTCTVTPGAESGTLVRWTATRLR
jgi:signal transduction histidine kinase